MADEHSGTPRVRYVVFTWVPEDLLESWNQWHNEVHVPEVLETPQMRAARKYRVADTTLPRGGAPVGHQRPDQRGDQQQKQRLGQEQAGGEDQRRLDGQDQRRSQGRVVGIGRYGWGVDAWLRG